jgi:hypothetical protein
MALINTADRIRLGNIGATRVYAGSTLVWERASYLTPTVGTVSTTDPGPLPNDVMFVFKVRGPTSGTSLYLAGQWVSPWSWQILRNVVSGALGYGVGTDGSAGSTTTRNVTHVVPTPTADEWIALSVTANNGSGQEVLTSRRSIDGGATWSTVATAQGTARVSFDTTAPLRIGSSTGGTTGDAWTGRIYWVEGWRTNVTTSGYLSFPGTNGNYAQGGRSVLSGPLTNLQFTARVRFNTLPAADTMIGGWASTHARFGFDASLKLTLSVLNTTFSPIGLAWSTAGIPGLTAGRDVWVRGQLVPATATCTYWYSFDDRNHPDEVSWTQLGTPVVGAAAGTTPVLTQSGVIMLGTYTSGGSNFNGRLYFFGEHDNGAVGYTASFDAPTKPADVLITGTPTFVPNVAQPDALMWKFDANDHAKAGSWLVPTEGTVSTPDPGPLPNQHIFVFKVRGPTGGTWHTLASQAVGGQLSWFVWRNATNGNLYLNIYPNLADGTGQVGYQIASQAVTGADEFLAFGITLNNAGRLWFDVWSSPDGAGWTKLRSQNMAASVIPADSSAVVRVGAYEGTASPWNGLIYSCELRSGLDPKGGSLLWRFDANEYPGTGTSYTDPRGRTWTLTNATCIHTPAVNTSYTDPRGRVWTLSAAGAIAGP